MQVMIVLLALWLALTTSFPSLRHPTASSTRLLAKKFEVLIRQNGNNLHILWLYSG